MSATITVLRLIYAQFYLIAFGGMFFPEALNRVYGLTFTVDDQLKDTYWWLGVAFLWAALLFTAAAQSEFAARKKILQYNMVAFVISAYGMAYVSHPHLYVPPAFVARRDVVDDVNSQKPILWRVYVLQPLASVWACYYSGEQDAEFKYD